MRKGTRRSERLVIGWREWISMPELGFTTIKAKIDTGARTSSLHGYGLEEFKRGGKKMLRFHVHPEQRNFVDSVMIESPLVDRRAVRPSSGHAELRPVIMTMVELLGERWQVELTITNRDEMGFRMLLGRQAIRGRFMVDPGVSFLNGRRIPGTKQLRRKN